MGTHKRQEYMLDEVAKLAGLSKQAVWNAIKTGKLPAFKAERCGHPLIMKAADVERYLADRKAKYKKSSR